MNKSEWLKAQQYYKSKINDAIDSLRYSKNSDKILDDLVNNRISVEKSEKIAIIDKSQENSASKFYRASRPILYPADVFTATFTAASTTSTLSTTSASSTNGNAISPPIDSISSSFSLDKLQDLRPWNDSLHGNHSLGLYIPGILIRTGT